MRLGFRKEARASQESGSIFQIPEGITKSRGTRERAWTVGIVSWGEGKSMGSSLSPSFLGKKEQPAERSQGSTWGEGGGAGNC